MGYEVIPEVTIGDPNKKELWDGITGNFPDHETRINSLEGGAKLITIINDTFLNAAQMTSGSVITEIILWQAKQTFNMTTAIISVLEAGSSGTVTMDVLKASSLDGAFASMLSTKPSVIYSEGDDSSSTNKVFSTTLVTAEDWIRIDLTSLQVPTRRLHLLVQGEI